MGCVMEILTFMDPVRGPSGMTTVMQCPGCEFWQVDYTVRVRRQWTPSLFRMRLNQLLEEHLNECVHLRMFIETSI